MVTKIETQLVRSHRRVNELVNKTADAKAGLLQAVADAVAEGYSLADIARTLDISKGRAQQLVRQADGRGRSSR